MMSELNNFKCGLRWISIYLLLEKPLSDRDRPSKIRNENNFSPIKEDRDRVLVHCDLGNHQHDLALFEMANSLFGKSTCKVR